MRNTLNFGGVRWAKLSGDRLSWPNEKPSLEYTRNSWNPVRRLNFESPSATHHAEVAGRFECEGLTEFQTLELPGVAPLVQVLEEGNGSAGVAHGLAGQTSTLTLVVVVAWSALLQHPGLHGPLASVAASQ